MDAARRFVVHVSKDTIKPDLGAGFFEKEIVSIDVLFPVRKQNSIQGN